MSDCKVYRREIEEAAGGGVSAGARSHLSSCRACGEGLRERERLRALVGGLGKVEAPADFEFRLRARMAAAKSGGGRGRFAGRWLYGFAPVAVAACFVVVSATLYFRQAARTAKSDAPAVAVAPTRNAEPARAPSVNDAQGRTTGPAPQRNTAGVASRKTDKRVRDVSPRVVRAREVASRSERRDDAAQRTAVNSVVGARVYRPVTITLKGPAEPLRMILRDERGAERVVPMRSVSFGSQDYLAREPALRSSGAAEVGGVW